MRCLIKLTIAIAIAVFAQTVVVRGMTEPGGTLEEMAFIVRIGVATCVRGQPIDSPELVGAAQRMAERRQGKRYPLPAADCMPPDDPRSQHRHAARPELAPTDLTPPAVELACVAPPPLPCED